MSPVLAILLVVLLVVAWGLLTRERPAADPAAPRGAEACGGCRHPCTSSESSHEPS